MTAEVLHPADDWIGLIQTGRRRARACRFRSFFTVAGAAEEIRRRSDYSHTTHEPISCAKCGLYHIQSKAAS